MIRRLVLLPVLLLAPVSERTPAADAGRLAAEPAGPPLVAPGYHQIKLNGHTFTLPVGFTIELAAAPPLADRPIVAALDEKGRLYVCDSSGSNEKVTEQMKKKPHRIMRLEDTDGDGKYDKSTVYVANVMFPEGAMWLNGSLYVAAVPNILKFTDTDDDGKADKEEIWFDGTKHSPTVGGCANDLHGPYLGPDGWIYWCKGGFEKQEYTVNGKPFKTRAAHIFRARPDGTGIEPVMTGGMDNPVDVVFTPSGERIFSCTFLQHPANGKRDGLIHAVYGGVYGKDWAPVYEHPWTSPHLLEPMTHLGPAAPCGLHRYESDQFGKEYENNLFCCQFNLRKVSRHVLVPKGSTFITKDSDFVVSDQHDFHPTDVIEDADCSLLILDTGGWYKLCCPSSQLVKPDVKGAIYRVKKTGAHTVADPRGEKIVWAKLSADELVKLLEDPRPVVWWKAVDRLAGRVQNDRPLTGLLGKAKGERAALGVVWALNRVPGEDARHALREALESKLPAVQVAASHSVAVWRDRTAMGYLSPLFHSYDHGKAPPPLAVRRAATEALGRIPSGAVGVEAVQEALIFEMDPVLEHSLTYALLELGPSKATERGLKLATPRVRRATLAALEQMSGGNLQPNAVLAELDSKDAALRETAWWIAARHPEWGNQLAEYFQERFKRLEKMTPPEQDELVGHAVAFAKTPAISKVLGEALSATPVAPGNRAVLRGLAKSGLKAFPAEWRDGVLLALNSRDPDTVRDAIAVLRAVPPSTAQFDDLADAMKKYRMRVGIETPPALALALRAAAPASTPLTGTDVEEAIANLHRDKDGPTRSAAADVLNRGKIESISLIALASHLADANPLEINRILPVFGKSTDADVGIALVRALNDPRLLPSVRVEVIKPILDKYPKSVQAEAEKLYAKLTEARKGETARLEQLLKDLPSGDVRRGQAVFNGAKAQCAACHKIGYVGGTVGPDLTRVGGIRTQRDLLESIVFPSASFVRSYEPVRVVTTDGRTLSGVIKTDGPDEIVLAIAADKEERIARKDIESLAPGTVSVMPDGLEKQLSVQELADLVAFLQACR
jgi:putative membrane-bound dehydrogenase-like protein